ncbi:MAG: P1 family peptidase [Deltaproteobacteria bacterium]|nr:P1 family peptidase [Deltaproteobacteria bacterium]
MKGGQGTASIRGRDGVVVGALAVVNAFGDVLDPETGEILAGARDPEHPERLAGAANRLGVDLDAAVPSPIENTTLGVVAIAADLSKPALTRVAGMALAGFARSISPAHCVFDGDVLFLLATGGPAANENTAGHLAARALAAAVADAVLAADGFGQIPDRRTLGKTLK